MFEKSVYTMDNANSIETVTEDKSIKTQSNEANSSSRTGPMKKVNGNVSSRDQSSKPSCLISWMSPFFFFFSYVYRSLLLYIVFYYSRDSFFSSLLPSSEKEIYFHETESDQSRIISQEISQRKHTCSRRIHISTFRIWRECSIEWEYRRINRWRKLKILIDWRTREFQLGTSLFVHSE